MVLKRVVRRALRGESAKPREAPRPPRRAPAQPEPPPATETKRKPPVAAGSIAARLAGGLTEDPAVQVKATSGASADLTEATVNHAEDGTPFWGELDNCSARAKAAGQTLVIDQWECISCGTCVENTDAVFVLPDDAKAVPLRQEGDMELIQDAIDACPVTCIHWTEAPDEFEQLNDADGNPVS